jgi:hypothetical protein
VDEEIKKEDEGKDKTCDEKTTKENVNNAGKNYEAQVMEMIDENLEKKDGNEKTE